MTQSLHISQRINAQIHHDSAGEEAEDIDANEGAAAEGRAKDHIQHEYDRHDCGHADRRVAHRLFHRQPLRQGEKPLLPTQTAM